LTVDKERRIWKGSCSNSLTFSDVDKKTNAPKDFADRVVAPLDWRPSGRGTGVDLVAAASNVWQVQKESGAIPANVNLKVEDAVDVRFLP
jgi:hypothetical protein